MMGSTLQTRYCLEELLKDKNQEIQAVFALDEETRVKEGGYTTRVRSAQFYDLAKEYGFELHLGSMKKQENYDLIKRLNPDLIIAPGSSEIIPENILTLPRLGAVGSHGAVLPYVKGGASMNWALICGEKYWGVSLFYLTPETDEGPIIGVKEFGIYENDDINMVHHRADLATINLLKEKLPLIENGDLQTIVDKVETIKLGGRKAQPKGSQINWKEIVEWNNQIIESYKNRDLNKRIHLPSRRANDGIIDWNKPAKEIYDWIRALTHPFNGAFTFLGDKKVYIWEAKVEGSFSENLEPGTNYDINNEGMYITTKDKKLLHISKVSYDNEPECFSGDFFRWHEIPFNFKFSIYPL